MSNGATEIKDKTMPVWHKVEDRINELKRKKK